MTDLIEAKKYLSSGANIALVYGKSVTVSQKTGIAPMMGFIDGGKNFKGYSVADKIVGKAAAMLFSMAGIEHVYAEVLSRAGKAYLERKNISVEFGVLVDVIVNRKGNGQCPMEECVKNIDDELTAYQALKREIQRLKGTKSERKI